MTGSVSRESTSVPPVRGQFSREGIRSSWGLLKLAYLFSFGIQGGWSICVTFWGKLSHVNSVCQLLSPSPPSASVIENWLHLGCYWCRYYLVAKDKRAGIKFLRIGISLVVQWLRIHLAMQGVQVWSLDQGTRIPHAKEQLSQSAWRVRGMQWKIPLATTQTWYSHINKYINKLLWINFKVWFILKLLGKMRQKLILLPFYIRNHQPH